MTLEQILAKTWECRHENGDFGIEACKQHIEEIEIGMKHKNLFELLGEYVERANKDVFFNKMMILACWEMINA